ncbi:hypothetical protein Tsubulata_030219 [Turnera subulata]|uniref:alpha-mannosidase n=1 Tax=Turnera subulata TaxID=218843 RepID=A0A9Q0G537_9ROSI|nr:hypothetical protein Tsubulata_030219 [Turnera subulata]
MGILRGDDSSWFSVCVVFLLCSTAVNGGYVKYNTGAGVVPGKLNVHLVPHSHDDVGWLKTVDQYYVGSNNSIQGACVENVLDSVVESLLRDPNRKFIFAEMAFFQRWWGEQSVDTQDKVRKLVDAGQLEFVNGGWCMHDEATAHYVDMIDQTTLGHFAIKEQFNMTPRAGWQIDPFGHSSVQAYLLGAELGFDSVHFARIDYQDREKRKNDKSLEFIWRGSKTFGSSSQIFTNTFPVHYSPPTGFHFEVFDNSEPVQDNPLLYDYNVEERVNDFVNVALVQANVTRTNHVMWTMGDDFQYQYAESWFKQMDKLIHYVNKDGRVNALYSTPSIYTDAKNAANISWPLKTDDFFPYADRENAYWTGFFTSRPALKRYVRKLSGYYLAARQLEFLVGKNSSGPNTFRLGDALGIAQHHDAVSGTAKQHTTNDYAKRLSIGAFEAEAVANSALSCLITGKSGDQCGAPALNFTQCPLLNVSYCPPTEEAIADGKSLVVVVYNPLGWNRSDVIRIPVNDANLIVKDSSGDVVEAQYVTMDNVTNNLRNFSLKAYLGLSSNQFPRYWLLFQVSVPPLGWSTYFISSSSAIGGRRNSLSVTDSPQNGTIEIGPGNLKMSFSSTTGQLIRMYNSKTGVDVPIQQSYLWYSSSTDAEQSSGAYIFRPDPFTPNIVARSVPLNVQRGPLVHEVHQKFNSWVYQVTRLHREKEHAEIEFTIGPIPVDDGVGKEVITQLTANMATNKAFYTDSNGRDFLQRIRDYRADWNLSVNQPVAGNYYPLNLGLYTKDGKSELSVLVDRATGGGSIKDGQVELMLHRRTLFDDSRGVGEALDESVCIEDACEGITIRGHYYVSIDQLGAGANWRRTTGQEIYSPLLLAFSHEKEENWKASYVTKATTMDPDYSLPPNVALITLQELDDGSVLLRLAHLYEEGEDANYSGLAKVELKKVFRGKTIKEVKETSLSANQEKSSVKRMAWKVEGDTERQQAPVRGSPVDNTALVVELGVNGGYVKYNTGAGVVPGKLNVHLVPHSHDDVGWLKTVDQYYVGSNNSIQGACVENVLDSVVESLLRDPNRKFIFAEMGLETLRYVIRLFFNDGGENKMWIHKTKNGGWCMHDEATTHYIDMIDQTTLGHLVIKEQFDKTPRAGWQIDPFGHSSVQAYLLGAELGFDSVHFARIDYQDRAKRKNDKSLEVIWRGSKTFGSSSQIFSNAFPIHYSPPTGFDFEVFEDFEPVQDNPLLHDYNVEKRVNDFVNAALVQANVTRTNHVMWTMGDDFQYQYAESWFKQMDKLIHYVNKDGRVNALYSTPSIYTDAKNAANISWPLKIDDYFPYADKENAYWTGFFTSRPAFKRYVRKLSGYYLATRQLEFLVGKNSSGPNTFRLGDALGIAQHHDAVTGTAMQHTTNDYAKRLAIGASEAERVVNSALSCLVTGRSGDQCGAPTLNFTQCPLLNISYCPPTEEAIQDGKSLVVVVYNPLGWNRTDVIRIPVNDANLVVKDSTGNLIETQHVTMDNVTNNLRNFSLKAYLGLSSNQFPRYRLLFQVSVPPLGWSTYFISSSSAIGKERNSLSMTDSPQNGTIEIGPGNLKMFFSSTTGQLIRMYDSKTRADVPVQQSYLWYSSSTDAEQSSGAYVFRPNPSPPNIVARSVPLHVQRGPLVHEVHQQFNSWINQVTRLYREKEHAEIEFTIGPIPLEDGVGKEVITQLTANMVTNKVFYTDSNGRDFLQRIRDYRADWNLSVNQPVAGNYYPLNLGLYIKDQKSELSVLVDRATGGGSIRDGQVELMLHRRLVVDDSRGVVGSLDESVCVGDQCEGITIRGNYYVSIDKLGAGASWRRTTGQEIYSPLLLAFAHEKEETWKASYVTKATVMDPDYSLPPNIALITLQELDDGSTLLRLAHLCEEGEDANYSGLAKVELKKVFRGRTIKEVKETSLSANQDKSAVKRMTWKVEGDTGTQPSPVRGGPVDNTALIVELGPMEIRTFLLKF